MRPLFYSLLGLIVFSANVNASIVYAKITGDTIQWSNAAVNGGEVQQNNWQRADKFNMLPVKRWSPAFYQSPSKLLTFTSQTGVSLETKFMETGADFRTSNSYELLDESIGAGANCRDAGVFGGDIILNSTSSCVAKFTLSHEQKLRPFDFYRTKFKLPNLISDFKSNNMPEGRYVASFNQSVAYFLIYENMLINSYQVYHDQVKLVIDYKPSFLESVTVRGSGEFELEYDTEEHSVKGDTQFLVNVKGLFNQGIKMSFASSGDANDFSIEHSVSGGSSKIPYSLNCERCKDKSIIENGIMNEDFASLDFVGTNLNFLLNFKFDGVNYGDVDEGDYNDAVTIIFELDL